MKQIKVQKRDNSIAEFNAFKILNAINKANNTVKDKEEISDNELERITELIYIDIKADSDKSWNVEEIQDKVVEFLLKLGYHETAISFIKYRERRDIDRSNKIDALDLINDYLDENSPNHDMAVHENASTGFSLQGMHQYIFESVIKKKWLSVFDERIKKSHNKGRLHIHDMGNLSVYCCGWDLKQVLVDGFNGVKDKVYCTPANHFSSALGQAVNFLYTTQGESAGAQAFSNFNTLMAPFIREDDLSYKQVKQAISSFIYNLNIPTRVGFQTPFTNITLDMDVKKTKLADEPVIISGGFHESWTYGDMQKEAQWINQAVVEIMEHGDGIGAPFSYPIVTFNVTKDFPWESKFGESLLKATSKFGPFYFANYINSEYSESDITSMCCRLRIDNKMVKSFAASGGLNEDDYDKTHQKGHGFFGAAPNTGSIGVVTLNLPAIMDDMFADEVIKMDWVIKDDVDLNNPHWNKFKSLVKDYMDLSAESLMVRRKKIEHYANIGLYPYIKHYLRHVKERTGLYFAQHFSTICTNGFHEAMMIWGFDHGMDDPRSWELAEDLLIFMKEYTIILQKKYNVLFNLEQSPAESAGVKLCEKSGIDPSENGYYTNSTWFPADSTVDMFDQIKVQSKLNEQYTGGSSLHLYTNVDLLPMYKDVKKIITYTLEETKLPYMTISPAFSLCTEHGRFPGIKEFCDICGKKLNTYLRIVGYTRLLENFNSGRKKEAIKRKYFKFKSFKSMNEEEK